MLLIAGASAAAVLCAGALWPDDDSAHSDAAESALFGGTTPGTAVTPAPSAGQATSPASPSPPEDVPGGDRYDPVAMAVAVLAALDACAVADDDECPEAIAADSSARASHVLRSESAGDPVLVDDYGDLAVIRLGSEGEGEQMLVLVRQEEEWLVRDVYDVADQPRDG